MSNTIKLKRSSVAGDIPLASDLDVGELAVNTADGLLFTKHTSNSVIQITATAGEYFDLATGSGDPSHQEGRIFYDEERDAVSYYTSDSSLKVRLGQDSLLRVYNDTASTITAGTPVYLTGESAAIPTIAKASANTEAESYAVGILPTDIPASSAGFVVLGGIVFFDTSSLTAGERVHVAPTAGTLQNAAPTYPYFATDMGIVLISSVSQGCVYVEVEHHSFEQLRITGNAHIDGNTTIEGNLTVSGTQTIASTESIAISSPFDYLNSGDTIGAANTSFTGTGLDDGTFTGHYNGTSTVTYYVKIDATGTPDTFSWSKDNFATTEATGVSITSNAIALDSGIKIIFNATTGHTVGDIWNGTAAPADSDTGLLSNRNTGATGVGYTHVGFFFDASTNKWTLFDEYDPEPENPINVADSSFSYGTLKLDTVEGALSGNATTASSLQTARSFSISGDVTASAQTFNGSANVTLTANINSQNLTAETVLASDDELIVYDVTAGAHRRATIADAALQGEKGQKGEAGVDGTIGVDGQKGQKGEAGADGTIGVDGQKGQKGEVGAAGATGAAGADGNDGATGQKGQKGEVGAQGATGTAGAKGQKGEVGAQGASGADGATGATGPAGADGSNGAAGQKGQKGEVGATGATGTAGATGADGADGGTGDKGQKGEVGATGATGGAGQKGQKGEVGATGATGGVGQKGQKGEVGATGASGSNGAAGQKGQKGEVGATGSTGSTGATGAAGATGAKGQKGEVGATGANGTTGQKGQKGEVGATGATGATGGTGQKGQKGEVGAAGSNGSTGAKGQKGEVGATGASGGTGQKGQKGEGGLTTTTANAVSGGAFATTGSPSSVLEYQQASSQTDTKLAPNTEWHNTIRMGHGNPYSYFSNTLAMRMTGTDAGSIFTQTISNNAAQGWRKVWDSGNDGAGSGLDADNLDGLTWDSAGKNVRGTEIYADNWFRNYNSGEGIYNQATGQHFYSDDDDYWNIAGGTAANGLRFRDEHNGTVRGYVYANNSSQIGFLNSSGSWSLKCDNSGNVIATGNVTAFSDERLKSDIETLDGSKVYEMRGVSFTKDGAAGSGVIAQELQKVAPELVQEGDEYLSVAYGNLVGYLIETVKELNERIKKLEDNAQKD